MNQGEFYSCSEYNAISEFKQFPPERYIKLDKEITSSDEIADSGKETTALQPKKKPKVESSPTTTLADRIFGSIKGVATAATVAGASAALITTLSVATPQVNPISLDVYDTYIEYQIEVSGLDEDGDYAIVLSTSNEEDTEIELEGDGTYQGRVEGLKPEWEYTLSLIGYDPVLGEVRHFHTKLQTLKHSDQQPIPPPEPEPEPKPEPEPEPEPEPAPAPVPTPVVDVERVSIAGTNKVQVNFTHRHLPDNGTVELDILYGDLTEDTLILTSTDIERGYVTVGMASSNTLKITPVVTDADAAVETVCESFTHTFEEHFLVDTMVGLAEERVTFYPTGLFCGAEYISITSSTAPDASEIYMLEDVIELWYNTGEAITYRMYLTNENGSVLSNEVSITVDTSTVIPEYTHYLSCPNPGDIAITYNDDGTINMYIQTDFEASSEDVYYQISVGGIRYISRDALARIENIPNESYPVRYDVCVDIDGQRYSIYHVTPSGLANEAYFYFGRELWGNTLTLQLDKDRMYVDLDSVRLVSASGEEITLSETDFVYDEERMEYTVSVEFADAPEYVVISMMANPYCLGLERIDGYIGNARTMLEETVYQP